MTTQRYLCDFAWLGGDDVRPAVLIEVSGDRITSVTPESFRAGVPGTVLLRGLTLPGLANVHSHAFHRALRGRTHAEAGSFWTWRDQMYDVAGRIDPDTYLALARATYAEMALAGITCVGEFHYLHHGVGGQPYDDPNAMAGALVHAAHDAGIRLTLLDTCYVAGGIGRASTACRRASATATPTGGRRGSRTCGVAIPTPPRYASERPSTRSEAYPRTRSARSRSGPRTALRPCTHTCPSRWPRTRRAMPLTDAPGAGARRRRCPRSAQHGGPRHPPDP